MKSLLKTLAPVAFVAAASVANAKWVEITIENLAPADGYSFSPVWVAFHDGTFDMFNSGEPASPAVEAMAELGDATLVGTAFATASADGAAGVVLPDLGYNGTVFVPGTVERFVVDLDPSEHMYMSFVTMVVPSNDWFMANEGPMAVQLFDSAGNFTPQTLTYAGIDVWEAGTEVNNVTATGGAAFVEGAVATEGADEDANIMVVAEASRDDYMGVMQPNDVTLGKPLDDTDIMSITVSAFAWGGYPVDDYGWANTTILGHAYVGLSPWIYSATLDSWAYVEEPDPTAEGTWVYIFNDTTESASE